MIQRIQSVYLFLAGLLTTSSFFFPLANINDGASQVAVNLYTATLDTPEATVISTHYQLAALAILSTALSWWTIFLFKNRKLQLKLSQLNILILVLLLVLAFYTVENISLSDDKTIKQNIEYGLAIYPPLAGIILNFLAFRGIRKDENLVRAADRLR